MSATPKTIILKGDPIRKEGVASEAITPGHLVEFGGSNDLQAHSTAGGNARKAFAVENDLVGGAITDAYAQDDTLQYVIARPGDEVYALLAHGENVSEGDALESDSNGALQEHTAPGGSDSGLQMDAIVGYALEDLNNTTGAEARIKVEVA
jgi:hypothetical protein